MSGRNPPQLHRALWNLDALGRAIEALGAQAQLGKPTVPIEAHPAAASVDGAWVHSVGERLGLELEPILPLHREVEALIASGGPAILQLGLDDQPKFLALVSGGKRAARVLSPTLELLDLPSGALAALLREEKERPIRPEIDLLLAGSALTGRALERARQRLLSQRLSERRLRACWILRPLPSTEPLKLAQRFGIPRLAGGVLLAHALQSTALIASFGVLGEAALKSQIETGWLAAWGLLLASIIPLRLLEVWWQGLLAIRLGGLLKQQLLAGILNLEPDEVRADGVGRHFGRVAEAETVEQLASSGGLVAILAFSDLLLSAGVIIQGAGGWPQAMALLVVATLAGSWLYLHFQRQRAWAQGRVELSGGLLERMIGHRTRLAQLRRGRWHEGEDEALENYHRLSERMDRAATRLTAVLPGAWLCLALLTLIPAFVIGPITVDRLAIAVGGMLLALRAFDELGVSFQQLSVVGSSFQQIRELLRSARRPPTTSKLSGGPPAGAKEGELLVDARNLGFRYRASGPEVLSDTNLEIRRGDRLLLEGPSGGGKSTLAALLTGVRRSTAGVLLLRGLDRPTLGQAGWRRLVTSAPQFHENHVFSGTLSFNLLMGRRWPPTPEDLAEAEEICRELGLGELLERMPGGLAQMVGESGWQLSHGERSRVFIARTLLQRTELVVLDESFAALDPETMRRSLECVLQRSPALLVIAHP